MKKIIALFIILIISLLSTTFAALIDVSKIGFVNESLAFPDLQTVVLDSHGRELYDEKTGQKYYAYHYATNEIIKSSAIGLTSGYGDGTFRPNEIVTKGEFIKLAIMLSTNRNFDFTAIPTNVNHWAGPYVAVAEMQNVVNESEYNELNLDEPITRIEMICILSKIQINMKGISQYRDAELPNYTDIDTLTDDEKELLLHAARYELISGMFDTDTIRPYGNLTRGEAAMAIMRIY